VYAIDLFGQFSGLRTFWAKARVVVLVIGTAFAAVIAHYFPTNIFGSASSNQSVGTGLVRSSAEACPLTIRIGVRTSCV
jgi:hypothetical protein